MFDVPVKHKSLGVLHPPAERRKGRFRAENVLKCQKSDSESVEKQDTDLS